MVLPLLLALALAQLRESRKEEEEEEDLGGEMPGCGPDACACNVQIWWGCRGARLAAAD